MNIIEKLIDQGFSFRTFPTYPRHLGVEKYHCAALVEVSEEGRLRQFSSAGYLLDSGEIALLVERNGRPTFVYKSKEVPAEDELMKQYQRFLHELHSILRQQ